jgi:hypothetical protein
MDAAKALSELYEQDAGTTAEGAKGEGEDAATGAEAGETTETPAENAEEGAEATEAKDDENAEPEADAEKRPAKLTPEQQKIFDARIGKEVGKRKAAEEKAQALEAELAAAKAAADEVQVAAANKLQVLSEYLKAGEAQVLKQDEAMETFLEWASEHWDGYEAPEGGKSYTAAQIRKRYAEVQRDQSRIARTADEIRARARKDMLTDLQEGRAARAARLKAEAALKNRTPAKPGTAVEPKPAAKPKSGDRLSPEAVFEKEGKDKNAAAKALAMM